MRGYSTDIHFEGKDGLASSLAVVNDSPFSDADANKAARDFVGAYDIEFHSSSKEVPRELSASYGILDDGRPQLLINPPRDGHITDVTEKPGLPRTYIMPGERNEQYAFFNYAQTNYAVDLM